MYNWTLTTKNRKTYETPENVTNTRQSRSENSKDAKLLQHKYGVALQDSEDDEIQEYNRTSNSGNEEMAKGAPVRVSLSKCQKPGTVLPEQLELPLLDFSFELSPIVSKQFSIHILTRLYKFILYNFYYFRSKTILIPRQKQVNLKNI